jgi:hypothetical protein
MVKPMPCFVIHHMTIIAQLPPPAFKVLSHQPSHLDSHYVIAHGSYSLRHTRVKTWHNAASLSTNIKSPPLATSVKECQARPPRLLFSLVCDLNSATLAVIAPRVSTYTQTALRRTTGTDGEAKSVAAMLLTPASPSAICCARHSLSIVHTSVFGSVRRAPQKWHNSSMPTKSNTE